MNLILKISNTTPCIPDVFTINGKKAYVADFGIFEHAKSKTRNCKWHIFVANRSPTKDLLYTYGITHNEYDSICNELTEKLSVNQLCTKCKKG